jgi:hypothetical protein
MVSWCSGRQTWLARSAASMTSLSEAGAGCGLTRMLGSSGVDTVEVTGLAGLKLFRTGRPAAAS